MTSSAIKAALMCLVTSSSLAQDPAITLQVSRASPGALAAAQLTPKTQSLVPALDLARAYALALERDPLLSATRATTQSRAEQLVQAQAQMRPNISASLSRFHNHLTRSAPDALGQMTSTNRNYASASESLVLRQPLIRQQQRSQTRQAQALVDDAKALLEQEEQHVGVRLCAAYFDVLLALEEQQLADSQHTALTTQLLAARKRFESGAGTRTDIDEAQAALDLNLAHKLEAKQNIALTERLLEAIIGEPVGRLAALNPAKVQLIAPDPASVEAWIELAFEQSPEIKALQAQLDASGFEIEKAKAGHMPTLDAIAQLSRSKSDNINSLDTRSTHGFVGLQLNVPLYSGGYVDSTVRQALADQQHQRDKLEAARRDLGVRIHREYRGVTEGILRVRALEQAAQSAAQVVRSNRRSFEAGSRTLMDTLNAEQQQVSARRDLAQARLQQLLSRVRLHALAGSPKGDVIAEINRWLVP